MHFEKKSEQVQGSSPEPPSHFLACPIRYGLQSQGWGLPGLHRITPVLELVPSVPQLLRPQGLCTCGSPCLACSFPLSDLYSAKPSLTAQYNTFSDCMNECHGYAFWKSSLHVMAEKNHCKTLLYEIRLEVAETTKGRCWSD